MTPQDENTQQTTNTNTSVVEPDIQTPASDLITNADVVQQTTPTPPEDNDVAIDVGSAAVDGADIEPPVDQTESSPTEPTDPTDPI